MDTFSPYTHGVDTLSIVQYIIDIYIPLFIPLHYGHVLPSTHTIDTFYVVHPYCGHLYIFDNPTTLRTPFTIYPHCRYLFCSSLHYKWMLACYFVCVCDTNYVCFQWPTWRRLFIIHIFMVWRETLVLVTYSYYEFTKFHHPNIYFSLWVKYRMCTVWVISSAA